MAIKYVFSIAVLTLAQVVVGFFIKTKLSSPDDQTISTPSAVYIVELERYGENDRVDTVISADGSTLLRIDRTANQFTIANATTNDTRVEISFDDMPERVLLSPDSTYLSGIVAEQIRIWNTVTGEEVATLVTDFAGPIDDIVWSQDSSRVLITSIDGNFEAFQMENQASIDLTMGVASAEIEAMAWDTDNALAAVVMVDGIQRLVSSDTRQFALDIELPESVSRIAIAPHDSLLVYGTLSGEVGLVDIVTGERVKTFEGHNSSILSIQWSQNGKQFVTTDADGIQIVWGIPSE